MQRTVVLNVVSLTRSLIGDGAPRPLYPADGRKLPDCYSIPPDLRDRFNAELGQFPLFQFWGAATFYGLLLRHLEAG